MQCKQCNEPVMVSITGLGKFCSWECRKKHRSEQNAKRYKNQAVMVADSENPYDGSCSQNSATKTPCFNGENGGSFSGSVTSSDMVEALGGKKWFDMAKRLCVNFDIRMKEGFCSYLFDPTKIHQKQCSRCELGQGLMRFDNNRKLVKRPPARVAV